MMRTFEELAGQELDALYQGALFLCGGDESDAERLLVDSMTLAFGEYAKVARIPSVERWLEGRLVRSYLKAQGGDPESIEEPTAVAALLSVDFEGLGPRQLFKAAESIPAWPRAALWLVLLRRWSYADAAGAMGVEREVIRELLRYRDVLVQEVMASGGRRGRVSNGG